jgi:hypothetical protein
LRERLIDEFAALDAERHVAQSAGEMDALAVCPAQMAEGVEAMYHELAVHRNQEDQPVDVEAIQGNSLRQCGVNDV